MSIFDGLMIAGEVISMVVKDVATEAIVGSIEKAQDVVDLTERRVYRRVDKIAEKEDNFNALFGLGKYKDASMKDRVTAVFAVKDTVKKTCAEYGDIIGVDRGPYQHYAIYIGNNRVIHYAGADKDVSFNATIREDNMSKFLDKSDTYFVFDCESREKHKLKINTTVGMITLKDVLSLFDDRKLLIAYNPRETVERAREKIGENKYNLIFNNCEHFAIWCKTGISKSTQVDKVLKVLIPITISRKIL